MVVLVLGLMHGDIARNASIDTEQADGHGDADYGIGQRYVAIIGPADNAYDNQRIHKLQEAAEQQAGTDYAPASCHRFRQAFVTWLVFVRRFHQYPNGA